MFCSPKAALMSVTTFLKICGRFYPCVTCSYMYLEPKIHPSEFFFLIKFEALYKVI